MFAKVVVGKKKIAQQGCQADAHNLAALTLVVESVEKVTKQILGQDAEKSELLKRTTINDLMLGKGQVTPENLVLTRQKDFSYRLVRLDHF
jgi:hypothetical protein